MNRCDTCNAHSFLYHNEATGLSLCEECDIATDNPLTIAAVRRKLWAANRTSEGMTLSNAEVALLWSSVLDDTTSALKLRDELAWATAALNTIRKVVA